LSRFEGPSSAACGETGARPRHAFSVSSAPLPAWGSEEFRAGSYSTAPRAPPENVLFVAWPSGSLVRRGGVGALGRGQSQVRGRGLGARGRTRGGEPASCATRGANTHRSDRISSKEQCSQWWASMPTDARVRWRARGVDRLACRALRCCARTSSAQKKVVELEKNQLETRRGSPICRFPLRDFFTSTPRVGSGSPAHSVCAQRDDALRDASRRARRRRVRERPPPRRRAGPAR
jgi:hypothetical protein